MLQLYALRIAIVIIACFSALSSVIGLGSIFQAIFYPMLVIGIGLELAKYSAISYVYTYYKELNWKLRIGAWIFIPLLVLFTSLGIYGYLGSAFTESNLARQKNQVVVVALTKQKARLEEHLASINKQIAELPTNFVKGRIRLMESFNTDKNHDQNELDAINIRLEKYQTESLDVESHMGVIMFVASALNVPIEKAIAVLILCLTLCLDPFAIYLTMLANKKSINYNKSIPDVTTDATSGSNMGQTQIDEFIRNQTAQAKADAVLIKDINIAFAEAKEPVPEPVIPAEEITEPFEPYVAVDQNTRTSELSGFDSETYETLGILEPVEWDLTKEPTPIVTIEEVDEPVIITETTAINEPTVVAPEVPRILEAMPHPGKHKYASEIPADNAPIQQGKAAHTDFGNAFPSSPERGDVYLRTDFLPNRLFKFNGAKWIEIDRSLIDGYAFEEQYIKHLINEISTGRYDADSLTDTEREQITTFLKRNA